MKRVLLFFLLFSAFVSQGQDVATLQDIFLKVTEDRSQLKALFEKVNLDEEKETPLEKGYKGVLKAMMAENVSNPFTKYQYFVSGKERLEEAIALEPTNMELRCLRLAMQLNTPIFLGYRSKIEEDKSFILGQMELDPSWTHHPVVVSIQPLVEGWEAPVEAKNPGQGQKQL